MRVQGTGNQQMVTALSKTAANPGKSSEAGEQVGIGAEQKDEPTVHRSQGKANGVIRKLQEGHFQGVAGLRLQINFHDRLLAAADQKATETLKEGAGELVNELEAMLFGGPESAGEASVTSSEQPADFTAIVNESGEEADVEGAFSVFTAKVGDLLAGGDNREITLEGIRNSFDDFIAALSPPAGQAAAAAQPEVEGLGVLEEVPGGEEGGIASGMPEGAEEISVDAAAAVDGADQADTEPTALDELTASLQQWFTERLGELESGIRSVSQLPELSGPGNNNGVAYDRFLEIYHNMSPALGESGTESEMPGGAEGVNTEV